MQGLGAGSLRGGVHGSGCQDGRLLPSQVIQYLAVDMEREKLRVCGRNMLGTAPSHHPSTPRMMVKDTRAES